MTTPSRPDDPLPELLSAVRDGISHESRGWRRVRSWSTPARHAAAMAVVLAVTLAALLLTPRLDLGAYPRPRLLASVAILVAAAALGLRELLRPHGLRERRVGTLLAVGAALLLVPLAAALLPPPHQQVHLHPESFEGVGADFVPRAVACLTFGLVVALPVVLATLGLSRHASLAPGRLALAAGVGGLAGTLGLLFHCPLVGISHRLAGHGGVGIAAAAGLAIALLLLRRSRKSAAGA